MDKLINLLFDINYKDAFPAFPVPTKVLTDVQNFLHKTKNFTYKLQSLSVTKDDVRFYLQQKNLYSNEEEIDYIMRDINTPLLFIDSTGYRILLKKYLKKYLLTDEGQYNMQAIEKLKAYGFKCYPFKYIGNTFILGIITHRGHIIFNPL